jgi:hypothetical protein
MSEVLIAGVKIDISDNEIDEVKETSIKIGSPIMLNIKNYSDFYDVYQGIITSAFKDSQTGDFCINVVYLSNGLTRTPSLNIITIKEKADHDKIYISNINSPNVEIMERINDAIKLLKLELKDMVSKKKFIESALIK